jgi:hypothetical protein
MGQAEFENQKSPSRCIQTETYGDHGSAEKREEGDYE